MNNLSITISLDDAFDCYEMSKRTVSANPLFYYDFEERKFVKIKNSIKNPGAVFINSYKLCSKLIDQYLGQPENKDYKSLFEKQWTKNQNKIVNFLWFFEHIDGCYNFQEYEVLCVTKELKKWCKNNNLNYLEPEIYRIC